MNIQILSFFIAPVIALLLIFYMKFKFQVKTYSLIKKAFLFGVISVLILVLAQILASYLRLDEPRSIRRMIFYAFVIIGFSSEFAKFLILRYYFQPKENFKGPLDGIIYSFLISLGFATVATILYAYNVIGSNVGLLFLFTYALANIVFAILLGFFVGLGKTRKNRFIDSMTGLLAAAFFHGLYILCFLTRDYRLLIILAVGSIIITILLTLKSLKVKVED
jgi:RsiW-degrading membrane proteinase PrsW (M82 family)